MDKSADKKVIVFVLFIVLPLTAGLYFYLKYNSDAFISKLVFGALEIIAIPERALRCEFFRKYFCDICWAISLESSVYAVMTNTRGRFAVSAVVSFCLSALLEFLQLAGLVSGTFDIADIIFETVAIIMAGLILNIILRRTKQ